MKNPISGRVKTRLAATIGNKQALIIYKKLLDHTFQITRILHCSKTIFYSDFIPDGPKPIGYTYQLQSGHNLGEKMLNAFRLAFDQHFSKVIIIGSDCFALQSDLLQRAFSCLETYDVVIGPAEDGGYYLLGMKQINEHLFQNKQWSTASVLDDTIHDCNKTGKSFILLPVLTDIDEEKDIPEDLLTYSLSTKIK